MSNIYPVLTTKEQLQSVASGTVVRSARGTIACRYDDYRGVLFGDERPFPWSALDVPAEVLWCIDALNAAGGEPE